jgi:hypothetical protein
MRNTPRRIMARMRPLAAGLGLLLVGTSCNSFLDPHPTDTLTQTNFYRTAADAVAAVNAVYGQEQYLYLFFFYISDVAGDDVFATNNFGTDGHQLADYTFDKTLYWFENIWANSYTIIQRANIVVDRVPAITMDTTERARIVGEARFLRALAYFNLVRMYGDVPVLLHAGTTPQSGLIPRTPLDSVYKVIISDLQAAAPALPTSYSGADVGRATSGAALSLLAKVYLTQQQWTLAAQTAGQVISSGNYALYTTWFDNFRIANQYVSSNKENIFTINYASPTEAAGVLGSITTLFALPQGYPGGDAYGLMQVNPKLVNSFSPTDQRGNHGTIMISPYTDEHNTTTSWTVPALDHNGGAGAAFHKYLDEENTQNLTARSWEQQANGWIILRYADVLLMYAEAVNEGGTPTSISRDAALNMVRQRADPGVPSLIGLTQTDFRDSLRIERRKEFGYEGQRWFDMARWGVIDSVVRVKTTDLSILYPGETTPHGAPSNLFPIPLAEIQVNPKLTQNPGW